MKKEEIPYYTSGIYKIVFNNDKIYIGLSNNIRRRMTEHLKKDIRDHPELPISKAILKHGIKDIEIIEKIPAENRNELIERERYWIKYFNSNNREYGYNIISGGDSASYGIENNASTLSQEQLDEIINYLRNTVLSYPEIGKKFNVCSEVINRINQGIHYYNSNLSYPIRDGIYSRFGLENPTSAFYKNEQKLLDIIDTIKKHPEFCLKDIAKQFNISNSLIVQINNGRSYKLENENYPIRKNAKSHKRIFSQEELVSIKNDLINSSLRMIEIGKKYNCDSKVISDINNGNRQKQEEWDYPLRKSRKGIKKAL